jgi:hypothetical protein
MTSHWEFYSQTGICIPLPVTRRKFGGQGFSFAILIIVNFVLFIFVAAGQASIFASVRHNTLADTQRKSRDKTIARRLITVELTDFLCWFPIGLCGVLSWSGAAIPGELGVFMATLVLPINAALNPFLYTFSLVAERRAKLLQGKLLQQLAKPVEG